MRSIMFNWPRVKAVLEERKTQTRRVIKPQPNNAPYIHKFPSGLIGWESETKHQYGNTTAHICGYGKPGDRLWMREAWRLTSINHTCDLGQFWTIQFKDYSVLAHPQQSRELFSNLIEKDTLEVGQTNIAFGRWRSSRFLPRWASRITLEITDIRAERIQDISEDDAKQEGVYDISIIDRGGYYS